MDTTSYAVALGSNRRHGRHGAPANVVAAAMAVLDESGMTVIARSNTRSTAPMGPAGRSFANAAVLVSTDLSPMALLVRLKAIERDFGRRGNKRWGQRVLDLDILFQLPGEGQGPAFNRDGPGSCLRKRTLLLPHPGVASRDFVLQPLEEVAPDWRHPRLRLTVRQFRSRLRRATPVDRSRRGP